jgi:tetratricopeptide (TPR) repeat protein
MPVESEILQRLAAASDQTDRLTLIRSLSTELDPSSPVGAYEYERLATAISTATPGLDQLSEQAWAGETNDGPSFLLFSVAFNARRRAIQMPDAQRLIREGRSRFGEYGLFRHYEAMSLLEGSAGDLRTGLPIARDAVRLLPGHAGAIHTCAVFIAELGAAGQASKEELAEGIRLADQAIAIHRDRGRFYATRATLLRLAGFYERARTDLATAIALESRTASDARQRIDGYLLQRAIIDALAEVDGKLNERAVALVAQVEAKTDEVVRRLDDSQVRVIETIGFVTAVLGIVLSSATMIGGNRSPADSAQILGVLAVILFGSVGLGSWILRRGRR